jgi:hypothetical protein
MVAVLFDSKVLGGSINPGLADILLTINGDAAFVLKK